MPFVPHAVLLAVAVARLFAPSLFTCLRPFFCLHPTTTSFYLPLRWRDAITVLRAFRRAAAFSCYYHYLLLPLLNYALV